MPDDPKNADLVCDPADNRPAADGGTAAYTKPAPAADHSEAGFVDQAQPGSKAPATEGPGTRIGPYKLLQEIGEGGMGTVFMAEQLEPLRRMVALKVIKPGMDSKEVLARFEAERQALALMDHPNIAKVLDSGTTDSGRPYFGMELVNGIPITKYCDEHQLTPRERLALFIPVCQAIQHAHQKGVIHRDIKPSNVLVASYDGKPVPKVIDFGVAKAMGQKLTERTMFTALGHIIGTFEYMSPEQAELNALDIDTRSDIYSLGVLLYQLLTGSTPLSRKRLKEAGLHEAMRLIREEEPPKPSTRLSGSESLPSISAQRKTEPAKLKKLMRGELDWIVMKSLEKDRSRRYETANGFARDVERFLNDEPVEACPPSATYRLGKFARRHKKVLVTVAVFVLVLILAAAISTHQAFRARDAEVIAKADRDRALAAERLASQRLDEVTKQKERAEQAEKKAAEETAIAKAVNDFLQQDLLRQTDSREQANRGFAPDPNLTVREALDRAAARIGERFQDQPLLEAAIRQAIGDTYVSVGGGVGEIKLGVFQLERALALRKEKLGPEHPLTLSSMKNLATALLWAGQAAEALVLLEETVRLRKASLQPDDPELLESMRELAVSYRAVGKGPDAIALQLETLKRAKAKLGPGHQLTLACMAELARDYLVAGQLAEAIALNEEALKLSKATLGPQHPQTLTSMMSLASAYGADARLEEAIGLLESTIKLMKANLVQDHPNTLLSMNLLAGYYSAQGKHSLAKPLLEAVLEAQKRKHGPSHLQVAGALAQLGQNRLLQQDFAEAERLLRECLGIREKHSPDNWQTSNAQSLLGGSLLGQKKYQEAEPLLLKGYQGLKMREDKMPPAARPRILEAVQRLVQLYDATGESEQAAKWRKEWEGPKKKYSEPKK